MEKEGKNSLYIIPSVDILNGKCVKLIQGKPGTGLEVSPDPVQVAKMWEEKGAEILHVVDLDAAIFGSKRSRKIVKEILRKISIPVEVGGGIRNIEEAVSLVKEGASWIILGTKAVEKPEFVGEVIEKVGSNHVIVALDSRKKLVLKKGWKDETQVSPFEFAKFFEPYNLASILFTDVEVEGTLTGINFENIVKLVNSTRIPITYSGGVSSIQDVLKLLNVNLRGVVVGRALYDGYFTLEEAMEVVKKCVKKKLNV
jgi:phosphoribosylformimino-5-aminoimidazole carboxamide ribotide isomerase